MELLETIPILLKAQMHLAFAHLTDVTIEHILQRFLSSSNSGQWCVSSYLTPAIGFVTIGFLLTVGVGERLFFFGRPSALIGAFLASSKASATLL